MIRILTLTLLTLISFNAHASEAHNPEGLWLTQNERSVIKVTKNSAGKLEGHIAWIVEGGMQFDEKNSDNAKRNNPMCGLKIMSDVTQGNNDKNKWHSGKIYKADDGDMYDVNLELLNAGKMKIRGFKGISLLGKTQHWMRVSAKDYPKCSPAKK